MSSHREAGDQAHVHDEAEETAEQGELANADLQQVAGGAGFMGGVHVGVRPYIDLNDPK